MRQLCEGFKSHFYVESLCILRYWLLDGFYKLSPPKQKPNYKIEGVIQLSYQVY